MPGRRFHVILSVPELSPEGFPAMVDNSIIYHGHLKVNRGLEKIAQAASAIKAPVSLRGWGPLEEDLANIENLTILPPVGMQELIPVARMHSIGLCCLEKTLNHRHALPNKFFEYLAAGLAVVVSEGDMADIVRAENCGVVLPEVEASSIAMAVNGLLEDKLRLNGFRARSLKAHQRRYNWQEESKKLKEIMEAVC